MQTLWFKRTKIFRVQRDGGEIRFQGQVGPRPQPNIPDWVLETLTYKLGIKDGSIVNLTPVARPSKKKVIDIDESPAQPFSPTNIGKNAADPEVQAAIAAANEASLDPEPEVVTKSKFGGSDGPAHPKGLAQAAAGAGRKGGRA
jgi:hypothetical protein